jgi:hypothetical protein
VDTPKCRVPMGKIPDGTLALPRGTIKRIHVNQGVIQHNKKHSAQLPVVTVQWRSKSYVVSTLAILGDSRVVYSPDKPLSCGAHVWVETTAEVVLNP